MTHTRQLPPWVGSRPMRDPRLNEVLCKTVPETLYHYTTQKGLLEILKTKEIWATHTQYLNDQEEYLRALTLFDARLEIAFEEAPDKDTAVLLAALRKKAVGFETNSVCVCSFSEVRDSLPQWRAYGEPHSGFAIGFSGSSLNEIARASRGSLVRCIYDEVEQEALIDALIKECLMRAQENKREQRKMWVTGALALLHRFAPAIKNPAFQEEMEWRLISPPGKPDQLHFREGRSTLVPYARLPLSVVGIDEVVVGPTINSTQARRAVQSLLFTHNLGEVRVINTAVPYRAW